MFWTYLIIIIPIYILGWEKIFYWKLLLGFYITNFYYPLQKGGCNLTHDSFLHHLKPYSNITEESYLNFTPSQLDHLVDSTARSLRVSLDSIAPVKKKTKPVKRLAPWYNLDTHKLKQKTHKLEKKWRSTKVEEFRMAWQDSLKVYRKALRWARKDYYSALIEENKNKPRI